MFLRPQLFIILRQKSPAAPWNSFTRAQQREAQQKVVAKHEEKIRATILHSR